MMRSLWAGVTGLQAHQIAMDVEGNNIANVNTTGFKYGRANFNDLMSQTAKVATAPQGKLGGKNPMQIGLGTQINSVTKIFKQGSVQTTDKQTDLAIQGEGFFVVSGDAGLSYKYTRNGDFVRDSLGNFVDNNGYIAQGWMRDDITGEIDPTTPITNIVIKPGLTTPANQTNYINLKANLNSGTNIGDKRTPIYTLDSNSEWEDINEDGVKNDNNIHLENDEAANSFRLTHDKQLRLKERGVDVGVLFNAAGESFGLRTGQGIWVSYAAARTKQLGFKEVDNHGIFQQYTDPHMTDANLESSRQLSIELNGVKIRQTVTSVDDVVTAINAKTSKTGVRAVKENGNKLVLSNDNKIGTTDSSKNIHLREDGPEGSDTTGLFGWLDSQPKRKANGEIEQVGGQDVWETVRTKSDNISGHGAGDMYYEGIEVITAYQYTYDSNAVGTNHRLDSQAARQFHTTEDLRAAMQEDARMWVNYSGIQCTNEEWEAKRTKNDGVTVEVNSKGEFVIKNPKGDAFNEDDGDVVDISTEAVDNRYENLWNSYVDYVKQDEKFSGTGDNVAEEGRLDAAITNANNDVERFETLAKQAANDLAAAQSNLSERTATFKQHEAKVKALEKEIARIDGDITKATEDARLKRESADALAGSATTAQEQVDAQDLLVAETTQQIEEQKTAKTEQEELLDGDGSTEPNVSEELADAKDRMGLTSFQAYATKRLGELGSESTSGELKGAKDASDSAKNAVSNWIAEWNKAHDQQSIAPVDDLNAINSKIDAVFSTPEDEEDKRQAKAKIATLLDTQKTTGETLEKLTQEKNTLSNLTQNIQGDIDAANQALTNAKNQIKELNTKLGNQNAERDRLQKAFESADRQAKNADKIAVVAETKVTNLNDQLTGKKRDLQEAERLRDAAEGPMQDAQLNYSNAENKLRGAKADLDIAKQTLKEAQEEYDTFTADWRKSREAMVRLIHDYSGDPMPVEDKSLPELERPADLRQRQDAYIAEHWKFGNNIGNVVVGDGAEIASNEDVNALDWASYDDGTQKNLLAALRKDIAWVAAPHQVDTEANDNKMFINISNLTNPDAGVNENDKFMKTMQGMQGALTTGDGQRQTQGMYLSAHSSSVDIFDSLGSKHSIKFDFTKVGYTDDGGTEWGMVIQVPEPCEINLEGGKDKNVLTGRVRFNSDGSLQGFFPSSISFTANNGSTPNQNIELNFGSSNDFDGLTSYDRESNTSTIGQDGYSGGDLNGLRVDESGTIIGSFSNGRSFGLAQVAMATFTNNEGLEADGGNVFIQTSNSGEAIIGAATTGGRGKVQASSLEMSNVDLSRSLTQLIVIQRGYQANSKTITTSDQMLNTLLQLKQ